MSNQPQLAPSVAATSPGPPIPSRDSSTKLDAAHVSNPFQVDLVIPYSISLGKLGKLTGQQEIRQGYEDLLRALEGEGGLRIASRAAVGAKSKEEVWIFVGAGEEKVKELVERER